MSTEESSSVGQHEPTLVPNLPLYNDRTARFSGAIWYEKIQEQNITLAGVGGIGSHVAFQLSRQQPASMLIYDPDHVEIVNMAGQLYGKSSLGLNKVDATALNLSEFSNYVKVTCLAQRFEKDSDITDIAICGFDNMQARTAFYNSWIKHIEGKPVEDKAKCLFIDGRMSVDEIQIFAIMGDDEYHQNEYKSTFLFSDQEAESTVCSNKQTSFVAGIIGGLITNIFVNFVANQCNPVVEWAVPFITKYNSKNILLEAKM